MCNSGGFMLAIVAHALLHVLTLCTYVFHGLLCIACAQLQFAIVPLQLAQAVKISEGGAPWSFQMSSL